MRSASLISPVLAPLKMKPRKPKDKRDTSAWSRRSLGNSLAGFSGLEQTVMSCAGTGDSQAGNQGLTVIRGIDRSKVSEIARFVSKRAVRYRIIDRARVRNGAGSEYWKDIQDQAGFQKQAEDQSARHKSPDTL